MFQEPVATLDSSTSMENLSCEAGTQVHSNLTTEASTQTCDKSGQAGCRYFTKPVKSVGVIKYTYCHVLI